MWRKDPSHPLYFQPLVGWVLSPRDTINASRNCSRGRRVRNIAMWWALSERAFDLRCWEARSSPSEENVDGVGTGWNLRLQTCHSTSSRSTQRTRFEVWGHRMDLENEELYNNRWGTTNRVCVWCMSEFVWCIVGAYVWGWRKCIGVYESAVGADQRNTLMYII